MDRNIQATTSVTNGEAQVTKDITKFTVHMYKNRKWIRKLQCMQKHSSVICSPPPLCMQKHSRHLFALSPVYAEALFSHLYAEALSNEMQKHSESFARPLPVVCRSTLSRGPPGGVL